MTSPYEDEYACTKLIYSYANLNDQGKWAEIASLYTEDGKYYRPTDPVNPVIGRENIHKSFIGRNARVTRHVVSNVVVDMKASDQATAFSVILLFAGAAASEDALPKLNAGMPLVGTFEDILVKKNGVWKFLERKGGLTFAKG